MTKSSFLPLFLPALQVARRYAVCCLVVFLPLTPFCAIAERDGNSPVGGIPDMTSSESRVARLSDKAITLLRENNLEEAMLAQRQLVLLLESLAGRRDARTRDAQTFLGELERVTGLSNQERTVYLVAHQRMVNGRARMAVEDYDQAEELLCNSLRCFTKLLGDNSVSVAATLENLGLINLMKENPSKAKEHFVRALAVRKVIIGQDHPGYSNALMLVGYACLQAKDFDQAEQFFRDALDRDRKLFGARSLRYAEGLVKLSRVMIEKRRFTEAEALSLQAISISEELQRHDSALMASCLFNLADVQIAYEEYRNAETNLGRSLALYEKDLPPWSPTIAGVLDRYAWLLRKLNRSDEASAIEARAGTIRAQRTSRGDRNVPR